MKRFSIFTCSILIILTLTACAPKTNSKPNSNDSTTHINNNHYVYEPYTLYFPIAEEHYLVKETQELEVSDNVSEEMRILAALKKGPKGDKLKSPLSPNAEITSVKTISGLCTINFSRDFLSAENNDTDSRSQKIQSIVHSLCELDTVNQVKINIDGKTDMKLDDEIDLSQPMSPDASYLQMDK